jgi:hypothetical protein
MPEPVYPFILWDDKFKDSMIFVLMFIVGTLCMCFTGYIQETVMARRFLNSW